MLFAFKTIKITRVYSYLIILFVALSCAKDEPVPTIGGLRGKITDAETSNLLKDVNVEIGGTSYTTGSDGAYFFNDLFAGTYIVSVSKSGFISDSKSVQVIAEQTAIADFIISKNLPTIQPSSISISDHEESKSVTLQNNQTNQITFSTQVSKSWITITPSSGTISAKSQTILNISIDFDVLDFGTLNENLIINVSGSSLTVPIIVTKTQPSFINILQPQENGIYAPEEIMPILWESNLNGTVDINLLRFGSSSIFRIIKESAENNEGGSYNWTIPELDQGQYSVQIISKEMVNISNTTGNFTIGTDPSIPFIQSNQVFNYIEGQEARFIIGTLEASDDVGIEKFEIVSGNSQGYFEISEIGKIILTDEGFTSPANDFEEVPNEFNLSIMATDGDGNESDAVEIIINVLDTDDEPPTIATGQSLTYSEGRSTSYLIGQVQAADNVGISSFEITSGNQNNYFTINDSGEIRLTSEGESSPANDFNREPNAFTIRVKAFDQSENVSEEVNVDLIVVEADDISPIIEENQSFSYEEGQSSNFIIGNIVASDNVEVTHFRINSGNNNNYFTINSLGELKLTSSGSALDSASNDFEKDPNEFTLSISALDATGNESDAVEIIINVLDTDDEPPTIATDQSFTYSEGRSTSYLIGQVQAADNVGISSFEITSGNQNNYFTINDSGEIRLTSDGESSPANDFIQEPNTFTIGVMAFDQSENVSEEVSVVLIVQEDSQNEEECSQEDISTGDLYELIIVNGLVFEVGDNILIKMKHDIYSMGQAKNVSLYKNDDKIKDYGNWLNFPSNERSFIIPDVDPSTCYNIRVTKEGSSVGDSDDEIYISVLFEIRK